MPFPRSAQVASPPPMGRFPNLGFYQVLRIALDAVIDNKEYAIPGDTLTAFSDGSLEGVFVRFDVGTNDQVSLNEFNPIEYPRGFDRFYLTTTAQSGKYLRLLIGRDAGAAASPSLTARLASVPFYTVTSDKDTHFTGSIVQNAIKNESISGLLYNKVRIVGASLWSDQQLKYRIILWSKSSYQDTTDIDADPFVGEVVFDLPADGVQVASANQYFLDMRLTGGLDYVDNDSTKKLHIGLQNLSSTTKNAGATGEVRVEVYYEPRV